MATAWEVGFRLLGLSLEFIPNRGKQEECETELRSFKRRP